MEREFISADCQQTLFSSEHDSRRGLDGLFNISSDNDFVTIRKTIENIKISKSS